jgi:Tfp pilus assembly protein PilF
MSRMEQLKVMMAENPADSFLQHALALEYIKEGNDNEARKLFESILNGEPGYVGSYYHLAKLLVRIGETEAALRVCENGMSEARKTGDQRAYNELRSIYEEMNF